MNNKHKSTYVYPAIFRPEEGKFHVYFPDFEGCFTCGDNLEDAMLMAADVLAFTIYEEYEAPGKVTPDASALSSIKVSKGEFVSFVVCDTKEYRRKFSKKAIKKTLSVE